MKNSIVRFLICIVGISIVFSGTAYSRTIPDTKIIPDLNYYMSKHKQEPANTEYILIIAKYYKQKKDFVESVLWYKKALSLDPGNTDIMYYTGLLTSWNGEYDEALSYFNSILTGMPDHFDAKLAKARVLSWMDKRNEALELCEEVLRADPGNVDAYSLKARILMWNADYKNARKIYGKILELDRSNRNARISLANIRALRGDYDTAIIDYRKMLKSTPSDTGLLLGLGKVLGWKGDFEKARDVISRVLEKDPYNKEAVETLSRIYRWTKKYDEGIELQKSQLRGNESDYRAYMEIALLYEMKGEKKRAIKWYEKAKKYKPSDPQINARLGMLYSQSDRIDAAISALQRSLNAQDNDVESLIALGRVYSWNMRLEDSISLYRRAIEIDPDNEEAYIGLGRTYFYGNDLKNAQLMMRKVLEMNPLNREASQELKRIASMKKPRISTRINVYSTEEKAAYTGDLEGKTARIEVAESADFYLAPGFSFGAQYKRITEHLKNGGIKEYGISADELGIYAIKDMGVPLKLRSKLVLGSYRDADSQIYTLKENEVFLSGYIVGQYDYHRWLFSASFEREPAYPILRSGELLIESINGFGILGEYSAPADFRVLVSMFYRDYYSEFKRNDYGFDLEYEFPALEGLELKYVFNYVTEPEDNINSAGAGYKNRFNRLNYHAEYVVTASSLEETLTQSMRIFADYKITRTLRSNIEFDYIFETGEDQDKGVIAKFFISYHF